MFDRESTLTRTDDARDVVGMVLDRAFGRRLEPDMGWIPACDIRETEEEVIVRAAMPGVAKEDIQLEVKDDALVLSGLRRADEGGEWLRKELPTGPFHRAFGLSSDVDAARVRAEHKDGILEVRLPKAERAKARKVEIK